jgi:sensor c-di-GMP phosphodiesterase-like protein
MGMRVVAEGVEDEVALRMLRSLDCDLAQGFLLSRPLPAREFGTWLEERTATSTTSITKLVRALPQVQQKAAKIVGS